MRYALSQILNNYLFLEFAEMSVQKLIWHCSPYNFYKLQIQDFIIEKITSMQVKSLPDLLQSSSIIGSALQETVSLKSLVSNLNSVQFNFDLNSHKD